MTSKARSKGTNKKPGTPAGATLANELRDMAGRLREAVDHVIEAQTAEDLCFRHEAFCDALRIISDTRHLLDDQATKLDAVQP
jgi:hypothetical protein